MINSGSYFNSLEGLNYWECDAADINRFMKDGIKRVEGYRENTEEIFFYCKNGAVVRMFHSQDCCESVSLYDDDGLTNGVDIFTGCDFCEVEISSNRNDPPTPDHYEYDSYTWTFIKFRTNKGYDTMRWFGESNGYYSESVDFEISFPKKGA